MVSHLKSRVLLLAILAFPAVAYSSDEPQVAETFAKAAEYIFSTDFLSEAPENWFTAAELELMRAHPGPLNRMIRAALNAQDSVGGAQLMGFYGLTENTDYLKFRFLKPRPPYGWEGTGPTEEDLLTDNQFVFHSRYFEVLQELYGDDVLAGIEISPREMNEIIGISQQADGRQRYWGIWMRRKLGF